jgi:hypothetical protein
VRGASRRCGGPLPLPPGGRLLLFLSILHRRPPLPPRGGPPTSRCGDATSSLPGYLPLRGCGCGLQASPMWTSFFFPFFAGLAREKRLLTWRGYKSRAVFV